jgi:RNA polymerase sigma factor for flagellar operon FliA
MCRRVWTRYARTEASVLRNWLIERYLPCVQRIAADQHRRLPKSVQLDELISAGTFGLMYAIARFSLSRKVKFETYCQQRIRGAMLDYLRSIDIASRLTREYASKVHGATAKLAQRLGRVPSEDELKTEMGVSDAKFKRMLRAAEPRREVSLSRERSGPDGSKELREIDLLEDTRRPALSRQVERADLRRVIERGLSRRDRLVLVLYYYEGMTQAEVAETLGITESRVCQIHKELLATLRSELTHTRRRDLSELAA